MSWKKQLARAYRRIAGPKPQLEPLPVSRATGLPQTPNRYFYLGSDLALVRLDSGPLLYVDPLDAQVSANIIAHGHWEMWIHNAILRLLQPGARVVEVGANVGYYTMIMAHHVGEQGHILSFEANPRLASLVRRSANLNGFGSRVQVLQKAAADKNVELEFMVSRHNSGGGYISVGGANPYDDGETLRVEGVRLDDLDLGPIDMIRMDAEGSEPLILDGAQKTLDANPNVILCMEWDIVQMNSRVSVPEFARQLSEKGFKFWRIQFDSSLAPVTGAELPFIDHCDIVACRRPLA